MNTSKIILSVAFIISLMTLCFQQEGRADEQNDLIVASGSKVKLDDGIEVELVAVSNLQWKFVWQRHLEALGSAEGPGTDLWWRPDGTLMENIKFKRGRQSLSNVSAFHFLVKVTGIKDADVVACKKVGGNIHKIYKGNIRDLQDNYMKDYYAFYIDDFPYPPSTTSLYVGIASGQWQVLESEKYNWADFQPENIDWSFNSALVGKWPYQEGHHVKVEISHTYVNAQTRLEMTDTEGKVHIADQRQRSAGQGIATVHYTFENTDMNDIDEIRFMKRDYTRWIEFKDVVLAFEGIKPFYTWGRLIDLKGKPAPEFAQIQDWSTGTPLQISDLKGKVVLLDFWNVNCSPCIALFPKLMSLHDKYYKQGLRIIGVHADIGVSTDQAKEQIEGFKEKVWKGRSIPFPIAFDGGGDTQRPNTTATSWGATNALYAITAYPTSILIDKKGNVVGEVSLHESGFEKQIENLLKQ